MEKNQLNFMPAKTEKTKNKSIAKEIYLLILSLLLIIIIFNVGYYKIWFKDRILQYWESFKIEKDNLDIETRKTNRYGNAYTISKIINSFFEQNKIKDPLVLIPSTSYFASFGVDYHVPEPAVFYYYTGLKTIWPNANPNDLSKAKWFVRIDTARLYIDSIPNQLKLDTILSQLKKYNVSL